MSRLAALAAIVVLLTACGPTASGTPAVSESLSGAPSGSTEPSESASPSASATGTAAPSEASTEAFAPDSVIEVLVTDLVVRSLPTVEPPSTILPARLTAPDRALVVEGPVEADGYAWYLVAPFGRGDGTRGPFGWVAEASREGDAWIGSVSLTCPDGSDLAEVVALQLLERLACFGDESLTLTAPVVSCGAGGGPWTFDPSWLGELSGCGLAPDTSGERGLIFRVPPGQTGPSEGPVTVTGHFDDPAAVTCSVTSADPTAYPPPSDAEAVVRCRTEFVLEP